MQSWYEYTNEVCPKCKRGVKRKCSWKYGTFYGCSRYPECQYTENIEWYNDFEKNKNKNKR